MSNDQPRKEGQFRDDMYDRDGYEKMPDGEEQAPEQARGMPASGEYSEDERLRFAIEGQTDQLQRIADALESQSKTMYGILSVLESRDAAQTDTDEDVGDTSDTENNADSGDNSPELRKNIERHMVENDVSPSTVRIVHEQDLLQFRLSQTEDMEEYDAWDDWTGQDKPYVDVGEWSDDGYPQNYIVTYGDAEDL